MDAEEKVKNFFKSLGWVIALILIGFIAGIYLSPIASGLEWPFGKGSYCQFGNFTNQAECDMNWCNNVLSNANQTCIFDINETVCKCIQIISPIVNETNQTQSAILSYDYYNKTDIENITSNLKKYMENLTVTLRNSMLDQLDNQTAPIFYGNDVDAQNSKPLPWYTWVIVSIIIMGGFFAISQSKKNQNMPSEASRKRQIMQRPMNFNKRPQNLAKTEHTPEIEEETDEEVM